MDGRVRRPRLRRVRRHELVQLLALRGQRAVRRDHRRAGCRRCTSRWRPTSAGGRLGLACLPLVEQGRHLFGLQQAREPEVVLLLLRAHGRVQAELLGVEEHVVEVRVGLQRLEGAVLELGLGLGAVRRGEQALLLRPERRLTLGGGLAIEGVVALDLHGGCVAEDHRHRGQEHRGRLTPLAGPHEASDGLREVQRRRGRRGIDAHAQARHVDTFGHHPHGHHPP